MDGNVTVEDEEALAPLNFWQSAHPPDLFTWTPYNPVPAVPRIDQAPPNYSLSQEGTSVANSHVPYNIRLYNDELKRRAAKCVSYSDLQLILIPNRY
jgi:hypothetical protein